MSPKYKKVPYSDILTAHEPQLKDNMRFKVNATIIYYMAIKRVKHPSGAQYQIVENLYPEAVLKKESNVINAKT